MTETFKSVLLFLLVTMSLILTYQLWYGETPAELTADDVYERVVVETPRPVEKLIAPKHIIVENNDESYLFRKDQSFYSKLWTELSKLLQDLEQDVVFTERSSPDNGVSNELGFHFNPALPVGEDMPWLPDTTKLDIDEIKLYSFKNENNNEVEEGEDNDTVIADDNDDLSDENEVSEEHEGVTNEKDWLLVLNQFENNNSRSLLLNDEKMEGMVNVLEQLDDKNEVGYTNLNSDLLEEKIGREIEVQSSIYVPNDIITMETFEVAPENLDREMLLKTFFVDYNLVRTIEEGDGGLIFTDGGKGLRISEIGIEYSDPGKEEGISSLNYREALRNSGRLISYHGGWPDNLRLEKLVFSSRGSYSYYDSEWLMYHKGYPIYMNNPTRALFNDLGLFNYSRSLFLPGGTSNDNDNSEVNQILDHEEEMNIAAWDKALYKAVTIYDADYPIRKPRLNLQAMELGYVITGNSLSFKALPVWLIQLDGEKIYLSAEKLEQIDEEDIY